MNIRLAWPQLQWDPWLLGIFAAIWEVIGRLMFPNWDVSYVLYGARFWMDRDGPWLSVWPGLDLLLGEIAKKIGQPEAAITIVGMVLNVMMTLIVWRICKQIQMDRTLIIAAALVTAFWFKPPLGGWVGDHLSFLVSLLPALLLAMQLGRWNAWLGIITGACLSYGLTLKLNNSAPGLTISAIWISLTLWQTNGRKLPGLKATARGVTWVLTGAGAMAMFLSVTIRMPGGVYPNIIDTYANVLKSQATIQANWLKIFQVPLQINLPEAIYNQQAGVLVFMPIVILYWISLCWSSWKLRDGGIITMRHATAILFLISTSIVGLSLGRGLTHRMFILPAGIIISLSDIPLALRKQKIIAIGLLGYLIANWLSFAYVQRNLEKHPGYNSRLLTQQQPLPKLCLISNNKTSESKLLFTNGNMTASEQDGTLENCWNSEEVKRDFAGLVDVQIIANTMGISFRNQEIGKGDFREKWDWRQATPKGRNEWLKRQLDLINKLKLPYLLERLPLTQAELEIPGYAAWKAPRLKQRQELINALGAEEIGKFEDITLWRTHWYKEK